VPVHQCATTGCENTVSRKGSRCQKCAYDWRRVTERVRRHSDDPGGGLPTDEVLEILDRLADARLAVDRLERVRFNAGERGEEELPFQPIDYCTQETRAILTGIEDKYRRWAGLRRDLKRQP